MDDIDWQRLLRDPSNQARIALRSGGRTMVLELAPDGARLRPYGGPSYYMGAVRNAREKTLPLWRPQVPDALRLRLCQALADAGFPKPEVEVYLVPDEVPSVVTVNAGEAVAHLEVPHRLKDVFPSLRAVLADLDQVIYETGERPSTERTDNPELDHW